MGNKEISTRIESIRKSYKDVKCKQVVLGNGAYVVILQGGFQSSNPQQYMDNVVSELVGKDSYNEFIEKFLDNPWVRIIIFDFNNIVFE